MWPYTPPGPVLILGSSQPLTDVDHVACAGHGIAVHRRRSGGGAVLVIPGEMVWVDVILPRHDPLWSTDVGRAMHWVGEAWASAVGERAGPLTVHRDRLVVDPRAAAVCFAGRGPGEVLAAGGAKVVGISQRRTAHWARFQTMCHLRWRPELMAELLAVPVDGDHLGGLVHAVDAEPGELLGALTAAIDDR